MSRTRRTLTPEQLQRDRNAVLVAAAFGAEARRDADAAEEYLDGIDPTTGDTVMLSYAAVVRGNLVMARGDVPQAERIVRTALEKLGDTKEDLLARTVLLTAPMFAVLNGDVTAAESLSDDLVGAARALGQPSGLAYAYYARGFVLSYAGTDHEAAIASLQESIELTRAGATDAVYPHALNTIARVQLLTGQARPALESLQLALAHAYRVGDMEATAPVIAYLIWGLGQLGPDEDAAVLCGAAFSGVFQMGFFDAEIEAMVATVRERSGGARYEEANARGTVMSYDEVVSFAVELCGQILNGDT